VSRRKLWIWALAAVFAAGVVAFVRYRSAGSDDLVVQLLDKETGKPMRNLNVTIFDSDAIPLLFKCKFLPWSVRRYYSCRTTKTGDDGSFRTRRILVSYPYPDSHIVVDVERGLKFDFRCQEGFFYVRPPIGTTPEVLVVPKKGTLVVRLDPAWMR